MKIGIIGAGMIGATAARIFAQVGHQVAISNSRGPASLSSLVQEAGSEVSAATIDEAASFGEVVLLAIPLKAYASLPAASLNGKIVIDAMNYYAERDGEIDLSNHASSELVAQHLPGSRVVKAFNTIYFKNLATQGKPTEPAETRLAIFISGDDVEAKAIVASLIDQIGFTAIDMGNLREGSRQQEPGSPIYAQSLTATQARQFLTAAQARDFLDRQ